MAGRRIPVTVDADTKGDFDKAARGLDGVASSADGAEGSLAKLSKGHQALDAEINKTAYSVKSLRAEFERTGDIGLLKDAKKLDNARKGLERLRTEFDLVGKASADSGKKMGLLDFAIDEWVVKVAKGTQSGIARGVDTLPAPTGLIQWLAVGAVAAAPVIGAAINAGVLLGVGGGVLAAGIIAAAQDPRVSGAYKELGGYAVQGFKSASAPLIEPLLSGAAKFEGAWTQMLPGIRSGMAQLAPVVDHIVDGVLGFIDKIGPGFGHAFQASLPILEQLGDELPRLGEAMGSFFDSIAEGGPGAVAFFHDLMTIINGTIVNTGLLIEGLSKLYLANRANALVFTGDWDGAVKSMTQVVYGTEKTASVAGATKGVFKAVGDAIKYVGVESAQTSDLARQVGFAAETAGLGARIAKVDFGTLATAIGDVGSTSDMLAGKMVDRLMGTMLGMSHATLGVQSSLLSLNDTFGQNGLAIDRHTGLVSMNTKAGISNREGVLGAIEANLRMYDAQINSGVGADVATAKYEANTQALHDQLRQAGLTEKQVSDLIGEYGKVPGKVNTAIAMNGLTEAINGLNDLLREILGLPSKKTITIEQITKRIDAGNVVPGAGGMRIQRWGGITEHAETGLLRDATVYSAVSSGARYAFAEPATQGEAFVPKNGDYGRSMSILDQAASWYDAAVVPRSSGHAAPVMAASGRGGGPAVVHNTFNIFDATDPDRVVAAIATYERNNGDGWRS